VVWGTITFFITGFPIGIWVSSQVFGGWGWTGIPFGWDVTDNKTLIVFLYYLIIILLTRNHLFKREGVKNVIGDRTFAKLTIIGTVFTLIVFIIPHSITNRILLRFLLGNMIYVVVLLLILLIYLVLRKRFKRGFKKG
jgi:hypothetical protein